MTDVFKKDFQQKKNCPNFVAFAILGPLPLFMYINDLSKRLDYGVARLFADDTNSTFSFCSFSALQNKMSKDVKDIPSWLSVNRLTLNVLKTDFMVVGSRQRVASLEEDVALSLLDTELEKVNSVKHLGVNIPYHQNLYFLI